MPELPEVETIMRGLTPVMAGQTIECVQLRRVDLRVPFPLHLKRNLEGRRIVSMSRRAKYMLCHLDDGHVVVIHLGMSGRMTIAHVGLEYVPLKHDHMIVRLASGASVVFNDPRRFGLVYHIKERELDQHPSFCGLGPEPLSDEFSGPVLEARLKGRSVPVKNALLDQKIVAGIGNIYASEALFQAGISPEKRAGLVKGDKAEALAAAIKDVLNRAIAAGGSSLKDFRKSDGTLGYFQHGFSVYDREGQSCASCHGNGKNTVIHKIVQAGRATYYCPVCQR